jgi:hypothetical protein
MPGRFEQFWTRQVSKTRFELSCIPFFTYGIALGDTVEVSSKGVVRRVTKKSGHKTLRVVVVDRREEAIIHPTLHEWVKNAGLLHEWCSPGYLSVDIPPDLDGRIDMSCIDKLSDAGRVSVEIDE